MTVMRKSDLEECLAELVNPIHQKLDNINRTFDRITKIDTSPGRLFMLATVLVALVLVML